MPGVLPLPSQSLAPGKYSIVIYDAQREFATYSYDWSDGETAVAPMQDGVAHIITPNVLFNVNSDGSVSEVDQYGSAVKFKSTAAAANGGSYLLFDLWMALKY